MTDRPHLRKVRHFESLRLFPNMVSNEYQVKIRLLDGTTYNPDYFDPESQTYIEVATSASNISEQGYKWWRASKQSCLRVFWWTGYELTRFFKGSGRFFTIPKCEPKG